ncbi:hypothetical protein ACN2CX_03240 [Aliarcobacter butzleri]|uniref:hypothetical protein n=1 Tax=Aliarcobacter butzleri TaxID=28197 RepID=UPI003AFA571A
MKRKSVYVYGYYGSGNFGDDLLLTTVLYTLKENNFAEKYYIKNNESINYLLDDIDVIQTNIEKHLKNKKVFLTK